VVENRVLGRAFGFERDEVTGEMRKLHNEEFYEMFCSHNIVRSKRPRWAGHVVCMGERRGVYRVLVGKREGNETTWETHA